MAMGRRARLRRWWPLLILGGCVSATSLGKWADFRSFTPPEALEGKLEKARHATYEHLLADRRLIATGGSDSLRFDPLGYVPRLAKDFDCIQEHPATALDTEEVDLLNANGFVISRARPYPSFALAYLSLYRQDLPVFVSADAILHAWHRAYDDMLVSVERTVLKEMLGRYLERARGRVASTGAPRDVKAHLDTYLTVAQSLLEDRVVAPRAGGSPSDVERLRDAAVAHGAIAQADLFGSPRLVDFSQFTPRGHYEKHPDLIPYFRAMMWLGTVDFRAIETLSNGETRFRRTQFDALVAAREAMDAEGFRLWQAIDRLVGFFVGMHDSMGPDQVDDLAAAMGAARIADLYLRADDVVEQTFRRTNYGKQYIMGHPYLTEGGTTLPLNRSFAIFGQRYSLESHTLHSVPYDRVPLRDLPTSRDVAFATLANDFALRLVDANDRANQPYVAALASMRVLSDGQKDAYWQSSLYSSWVWALRALSPTDESWPRASVTRTEGWARRMLATQLASWSELRHDTILYAKQSYTTMAVCEYPDAFVDPYPEFFHRMVKQSEMGLVVVSGIEPLAATKEQLAALRSARSYFEKSRDILRELEGMADRNARGLHVTHEQLKFVNHMIDAHSVGGGRGCGGGTLVYDGWYRDLLNGADVHDPDYTVADVHTGQHGILHVGKQKPRRIVVTVDWPDGVYAYAGAAFSFHEVVHSKRLTDSEWAGMDPPDPPWLAPIVAHARVFDWQSDTGESIDGVTRR